MSRILGVNGIHVWSWSKDSFTDRLLDALSHEHEVVDIQYPRMWALLAYFDHAIERRADRIVANNTPGDVLIAHSFGCLASIYAMRKGAKFSKVFFFGAAAEVDIALPDDAFDELYNIHSNTDRALLAGKNLPFHKFGYLGREGYAGKSTKVFNVPANGLDHSDYVSARNLCRWANFIHERISKGI